jgi:proteasome lid subunit RPN8/RPN11
MSLSMPPELVRAIRLHAEEGFPHEVCGLLLGRASNGGRLAVETYRLENERPDSRENRYAVSGRSMLRAERHAEESGLDVVGYYHSHPNAPARPSGYDLEHATWPGISYPIVSVVDGTAVDVRSFALADDRSAFVEEQIEEAPRAETEE